MTGTLSRPVIGASDPALLTPDDVGTTPRRRRWRPGSAARLASLHALVLAAVLGGSVVALVRNSRTGDQQIAARQMVAELRTYQDAAASAAPTADVLTFSEGYLRTHAVASGAAVIISITGRGTVGSPDAGRALADPAVQRRLAAPPARTATDETQMVGEPVEVLAAPIVRDGRPVGTYLAVSDLSIFGTVQARIRNISALESIIALIVGVSSAYLLLRRLLRRIGRITTTADRISQARMDERLGDQGTDDEVGQLAESFDAMLDRIETAVGAQRRLLSDLSHQLRTPLTVARGHLEVLTRTDLGDEQATRVTVELVVDELDHMRSLIERLSLLGQAMEPDALTVDRVDVRTFLTDLWDGCQVLAPRQWVLGMLPDVVIEGDIAKLRGALLNVVDNAVKSTAAGDGIFMAAHVDPSGEWLRISVGDSGPGIPAAQRDAVLDRFSRPGARDAGGTGLGLAIVKAVAESHGGRIDLGSSALGGAEVTIVLPVQQCGS